MKKLFTLCASLFVGFATMNAQTFAFVNEEGNVIENGSKLTMTTVEFAEGWGDVLIPLEGITVKNVSSASATFDINFTVDAIPGGRFQACCLGTCNAPVDEVGAVVSYPGNKLAAGNTADLNLTEWYPGGMGTPIGTGSGGAPVFGEPITGGVTDGTCTVTIEVMPAGSTTPEAYITVDFVIGGEAGVSGVVAEKENPVVGYYTIGGAQLNAPQKGINIVKYADGTTKKVILK